MTTASREERHSALEAVLRQSGYGADLLQRGFTVWSQFANVQVDLMAFGRSDQKDLSTSAVLAQVVDYEEEVFTRWARVAADIAAPAMLIALPDRLSLWSIASHGEAIEVETASIFEPTRVLSRLAHLTPEAVTRAKNLGIQIPLFPLDVRLLEESRRTSRNRLTDHVERAMQAAGALDPSGHERIPAQLVIGALAVLMIRDKTDVSAVTSPALIDVAQQRFPGYFRWLSQLTESQFDMFDNLVLDLGAQISFAGLEPAMVSDVYENALVSQEQRREQGTYYTPPALARQMMRMIPVERIRPNDRFVLDPACGSGTLLLAAAGRLDQLQPYGADHHTRHRYLTSHLRGYDRDAFATEVTKLSLLMTALPAGNSWRVESRDVLAAPLNASDRPSMIVSNPPWQYSRGTGNPIQRANYFLDWMLRNLAPGGFLACVLPLSWINSLTSRSARRALLNQADLLEVWRLPDATFSHTSQAIAPAVVIAQKTGEPHRAGRMTLIKRINGGDRPLDEFLTDGLSSVAYLSSPGEDGSSLLDGPLTRYLERSTKLMPLAQAAIVRNGPPQKPGREKRRPNEATHWELKSLRDLPAFGVPSGETLVPVRYPEDFHNAGQSDALIRMQKVIVVAKRWSARDPWRIKAGFDLDGVVPRESFHMVIPNDQWSGWGDLDAAARLNALLALLGSGLASCWVDEREPGRNVPPEVIRRLPIPTAPTSISRLAAAGASMVAAVESGDIGEVGQAGRWLENTVADVYELPDEIRDLLVSSLGGELAPEGTIRIPRRLPVLGVDHHEEALSLGDLPSFGHVLDATQDGLRIWVSGLTDPDGVIIGAPLRAPGWLCQPGVDFVVHGDLSDLARASFQLHTYDWLPEGRYSESTT